MILAETVQQLNSHMVWDFILLITFIWVCAADHYMREALMARKRPVEMDGRE
jgi:hypothetical protein